MFSFSGGELTYDIKKNNGKEEAVITGFNGLASCLVLPEQIEGYPVTEIGRKAFLSKKQLREVVLPSTLARIDDWAFAYCNGLECVVLPRGPLSLGRAVFLECGNLKRLEVKGESGMVGPDSVLQVPAVETVTEAISSVAELMAAAVNFYEAYYLVDPITAGDSEWLAKWDNRMLSYLHTDDQEGYSKQVLCGEEDYGSTDLVAFLNGRRKSKVRLSFLRLLNPIGLSEENKQELEQYLLCHTKGESGEEAWEVVFSEHGEERRYFELFAQTGCLTEENFNAIMGDIGENYPEMKAYFLKVKEEKIGYEDFFEGLKEW